ncbi:MAG TPA: nitrate reductase molybdenum cofactor assembly chaperone [Anaerolineales bacterium]|nr:nitrate reductase molybdenum cofactor assembly chaperone [Anaerolineales bacterium]
MRNEGLELFAGLLEYPTSALPGQVEACIECLDAEPPEAVAMLAKFQHELEHHSPAQMEELYTRTFDMQPVCYPYVGYHLFGESYKRGAFMAKLVEGYRALGYAVENELPDHVAVVLHFLALGTRARDSEFGRTLLLEGLLPALEKMTAALEGEPSSPYGAVLSALRLVLDDSTEKETVDA